MDSAAQTVDCRVKKCIALTFDDGPGPYTDKLLSMLAVHHARVTFFLIGGTSEAARPSYDASSPQGTRSAITPGPILSSRPSDKAIKSQLARTLKEIQRATGGTTHLMRPPYGATNKRVGKVARGFGMAQIRWSVDTNRLARPEFEDRGPPGRFLGPPERHHPHARHSPHNGQSRAEVLNGLSKRGFTFVTVPELFAPHPLKPGTAYFSRK